MPVLTDYAVDWISLRDILRQTDNELRVRLERADRYHKQLRLLSKGQVKLTQELVEKCKTDKWKRKLAEAAIKGRVARM